jgi:deoxyribonuclease-1-like protein
MKRAIPFMSGVFVAAAGWLILQKFEIHGWSVRTEQDQKGPRPAGPADPTPTSRVPSTRSLGAIRIASFNLHAFGGAKGRKPRVQDTLSRIVRQFDVVALQEVCTQDDLLPAFVAFVNGSGRHYDYVTGRRLGRAERKEQCAYLYDRATIEVDRSQSYTVSDPDDLLHREPFVAWFRVRGPASDRAFTFSLVNVHLDSELAQQELDVLADVYQAIRDDGRQEDDVIILGDMGINSGHLGRLAQIPGMSVVLAGQPTDTRGTQQLDNIVFCLPATAEFTGHCGVFDFLREYNLNVEEALEVSSHLPIWAEFNRLEGGQPHSVAKGIDRRSRE